MIDEYRRAASQKQDMHREEPLWTDGDRPRDLAAGGTSVVVVEHDLNVIWNLCDEVLFMAEGSVILRGAPKTIRENRTVVEKYLGEGHV